MTVNNRYTYIPYILKRNYARTLQKYCGSDKNGKCMSKILTNPGKFYKIVCENVFYLLLPAEVLLWRCQNTVVYVHMFKDNLVQRHTYTKYVWKAEMDDMHLNVTEVTACGL